ncbi:hypothetical protein [Curtobacterium sp. B8]|uniref:hypothetical protein n=1 Tax=Curtobacterium sp. B8 TaxID=95611 RepID=UPI00034A7C8B|nr:hypothetical protein [Curtobacterium sp. B8]
MTLLTMSAVVAATPAMAAPTVWPASLTVAGGSSVQGITIHDGLLYAADHGTGRFTTTTPGGSTKTVLTVEGGEPAAVAVDSKGDVAFTLDSDPTVYQVAASALPLTVSANSLSTDPNVQVRYHQTGTEYFYGLAFDASDNLYFGKSVNASVYELPAGQQTVVTTVVGLEAGVDGMGFAPDGSLYFATDDGEVHNATKSQLQGSLPLSPADLHTQPDGDAYMGIAFTGTGLEHYESLGGGNVVALAKFEGPYTPGTVTVAGTARVGETLTAKLSGWPSDSEYTYQWLRNSQAISGATSKTYQLTDVEIGAQITVSVTGSANGESATVTSNPVGPVGRALPLSAPLFNGQSDVSLSRTVTAGERFSFTGFGATGNPAPTYTVTSDANADRSLPTGVTFKNGTLSGVLTDIGSPEIVVTAKNSQGQAVERIELIVNPAKPIGLKAVVSPQRWESKDEPVWEVAPDGSVTQWLTSGEKPDATITAKQGSTLEVDVVKVDKYGNPVTSLKRVSVTSSIGTDTVKALGQDDATITFNHASPHVITIRQDGFVNTFTIQVSPQTVASPTATPTATAAADSLAFTGANVAMPMGVALVLFFIGGILLIWTHLRKRRIGRHN